MLSARPLNMPAVSIIMNVRNGAATLREAIDSALAQTISDWELIVWDDCSTDDTPGIVAEYADARITYVRSEVTISLGEARQQAIDLAQGEWLAFLDQDDLWLPRKLELQLERADSPVVGIIYGRALSFGGRGGQRDYDYFHEFALLPEGEILAELLGRGCFIAMSSVLLRRSAVVEVGPMPEHIRITPDYFLYAAVCSRYEARAVQHVVCKIRVHPGSMTNVYRREAAEETLKITENWRNEISPDSFARRHAHISTALALEEMRRPASLDRGLRRLFSDGSVVWLAGRPFVHLWRAIHRRLRRPYWKKISRP